MKRLHYLNSIEHAFKVNPVVALLGPRQCGKTTLARDFIKTVPDFNEANYFDLEDPTHLDRLSQNPKVALSMLSGLVVIDEIQRIPELFPLLRVLVDDLNLKLNFLILGSASRDLIRQSSETLAGRITHLEITPFSLYETEDIKKLWIRGGFPRSYLAANDMISFDWRKDYISTFLERDIPLLGIQIPSQQLRRFWMMLAHYHASIFNASELGNSLDLAHTTVRRYLDILVGTFMVRQLKPWFQNINKREVKHPKVFLRDSGLLHNLLGILNEESLLVHPKLGSSWEGMALEQVIRLYQADSEDCYFWGVHNQGELDLMIIKDGKKLGFEFKFSESAKLTPSILMAMEYLKLDSINVIVPTKANYPLAPRVFVKGITDLFLSKNL
jgi:predicted AAA+ superfamily ATPase